MTLEEQKLAVCEKLHGIVCIHRFTAVDGKKTWTVNEFRWADGELEINWPTEGLQVCHEAEKLLISDPLYDNGLLYSRTLRRLTSDCSDEWQWHATYEQRLEALCRVWWPEKFKE